MGKLGEEPSRGGPRPVPKPEPRPLTLDQLRGIVDKPFISTGEFRLNPVALDIEGSLPAVRMDEDTDEALADQANTAYTDELRKHVEIKGNIELLGKHARLNFIRGSLGYGDHRLARHLAITRSEKDKKGDLRFAQYLGITENQVQRSDLRGRRKKEVARFEQRFNGLFALSSILVESVEDVIDRRVALETPSGKLSDVSVGDAIKVGYINIAVAIALEAVRQSEETMGYQKRTPGEDSF